jgi:microcystin-dependent protein
MLTSTRFQVQYPQLTDSPDVPRDFAQVVTQGIERAILHGGSGTLAARPTSSPGTPGIVGRLYAATDQSPPRLFFDYGTGWFDVGALVALSVGTAQIVDGSVTAAKIATDTITATQIAPDAVGASEIAAGAVGNSELAANSVASGNMQANSVPTAAIQANAVTFAKVASDVPVVPVGAVMDWPWHHNSIPSWALLPYGQLLTQAAYPAMQVLADAASRPYGGTAGTNFNMPDMRGRSAVGKDDMGGVTAGRITLAISGITGVTLGSAGGAEGITLSTAQIPAHNHTQTAHSHTVAAHSHTVNAHSHTVNAHNHGLTGGVITGYASLQQNQHYHATSHVYWTGESSTEFGQVGAVAGGGSAIYGSQAATGATADISDGGHTHTHNFAVSNASPGTDAQSPGTSSASPGTDSQTPAIQNTGGDGVHSNVPPTIIVNKLMRVL